MGIRRVYFSFFKPTGVLHFEIKFWNNLVISKRIIKNLNSVLHVQNRSVLKKKKNKKHCVAFTRVSWCDVIMIIFTCTFFVFYYVHVNTCVTFAQKYVFTFVYRINAWILSCNKINAVAYMIGNGRGLVIEMSRVRISLPSNQEWAYLVWKGSYIDIFGCQHLFCYVDILARKSGYVMASVPGRIKVGVRRGQLCPGRLFYYIHHNLNIT